MTKNIKILLLGILLSINLQAIAQDFYVTNNSEVKALASKLELTRISFDSPVIEIHSLSDEIDYVIQEQDIYLRITTDKPVNLFVKTEDKSVYKLMLIIKDIPATQIFIHNKYAKLKNAQKTEYFGETSALLKSSISKIIEVSLNPTKHIGYKIEKKDIYISGFFNPIKMKLEALISNNHLVAEKIRITNKTKSLINLKISDFLKPETPEIIAVYIAKSQLLPKEETILIRILEK